MFGVSAVYNASLRLIYFIVPWRRADIWFDTIERVVKKSHIPVYSIDDDSFLGFVINDGATWRAVTIFGYLISHATTQKDAESILQDQGPDYLKGLWQYYDKDDKDWFPCVIKKAFEQRVIVNRTNNLGYQDPDDYKQVVIEDPTENDLVKSS